MESDAGGGRRQILQQVGGGERGAILGSGPAKVVGWEKAREREKKN